MPFPPVSQEYSTLLEKKGYNQQEILVAWQYAHFCNNQFSADNAQTILDYCCQKGYTPKCTFNQWNDGYIVARDQKNRQILVVGSFNNGKYTLRGTLRAKSRFKKMTFFCNGQASTNSVQLCHIAEQDEVHFTDFQEIEENRKLIPTS
jgi:hypothetical protein